MTASESEEKLRNEYKKATMVLEGGATRGVFTSGVLDLLMEKDIYTSHVIGVSAGACNALSYVSRQPGRTRDCMIPKEKDLGYYYGIRDFVKEKSVMNMDMIFDRYPKEIYPFDFALMISYEIWGEGIRIRFNVENTGTEEMIFALGGHPAFNIPLTEDLSFEDYFIAFSPQKSRVKIPLEGPFANLDQKTIGQTNTNIQLSHDLFREDALIYETKGLNAYTLGSEESPHSVTLAYNNIPYVGLWSPYPTEAPFVCIEPWWGFADTVDSNGQLEDKEGMNRLAAKETFKTEFSITVS